MARMDYKRACRLFFWFFIIAVISGFSFLAAGFIVYDDDFELSRIFAKLFCVCTVIFAISLLCFGITSALYREKEYYRIGKWPVVKSMCSFLLHNDWGDKYRKGPLPFDEEIPEGSSWRVPIEQLELEKQYYNGNKRKAKFILSTFVIFMISFFLLIGGWESGGIIGVTMGFVQILFVCYLYYMMYKERVRFKIFVLAYVITFIGVFWLLGTLFPD